MFGGCFRSEHSAEMATASGSPWQFMSVDEQMVGPGWDAWMVSLQPLISCSFQPHTNVWFHGFLSDLIS